MPDIVLRCGQIVQVSDEDYDWAKAISWRSWSNNWKGRIVHVVSDEYATGFNGQLTSFRRRLMREIAARMDPGFLRVKHLARVSPINGDNFDARRENILVKYNRPRRTRPPTPKGHRRKNAKGIAHGNPCNQHTSPLWNPNLRRTDYRKKNKRGGANRTPGPGGDSVHPDHAG